MGNTRPHSPLTQAKVFQVAREDGSPTGKVIKINHADMASKMLNNNVVGAEQHRVSQQLSAGFTTAWCGFHNPTGHCMLA